MKTEKAIIIAKKYLAKDKKSALNGFKIENNSLVVNFETGMIKIDLDDKFEDGLYIEGPGGLIPSEHHLTRYPADIEMQPSDIIKVDSENIVEASVYASDDETRYFMNGIYFSSEDQKMVATDGRRIIVIDQKVSGPSVTIPTNKLSNASLKSIKDFSTTKNDEGKEFAKLYFSEKSGDYDITLNAIEGQFPNWKRFIPEDVSDAKLFLPPQEKELKEILRYIDKKTKRITFCEDDTYYYDLQNGGSFGLSTQEISFALNAQFLYDFVCYNPGKSLKFTDRNKAFWYRGEGKTVVIMPMILD